MNYSGWILFLNIPIFGQFFAPHPNKNILVAIRKIINKGPNNPSDNDITQI